MTTLQKAETDRKILEADLSAVEQRILKNTVTPLTLHSLKTQFNKIQHVQVSIREIQSRILSTSLSTDEEKTHTDKYNSIMERVDKAVDELNEFQSNLNPSSSSGGPPPTTTARMNSVKLPDIKLPTFSSNYEDWTSFADLFHATVHSNKLLTASLKLQYLKGCCPSGTAHSLIKSLKITDANYQIAWDILERYFNNLREIITSLVRKLLNQPAVKSESASCLQTLLNTTMDSLRALEVMGEPVDKWDSLLVVHLVDKLDPDTRSEWAKTLVTTSPSTFQEFTTFLEMHIRSLHARETINSNSTSSNSKQDGQKKGKISSHQVSTSNNTCKLCNDGQHGLYQCPKFLAMEPSERKSAVKQLRACMNCLRLGHSFSACTSGTCRKCNLKHHTLLHFPTQSNNPSNSNGNNHNQSTQQSGSSSPIVRSSNTASAPMPTNCQVLLKTAIVLVDDQFGNKRPCRILLDDGSEASFISANCANALGLPKSKTNMTIEGIGGVVAHQVKWKVDIQLTSRYNTHSVGAEAYILPKVTAAHPRLPCNPVKWNHLKGLQLADESYHTPGEVDILLGEDILDDIMIKGKRKGPKFSPTARNSIFGWVLSGKVESSSHSIIQAHHVHLSLEDLVHKFWELSEVPNRRPFTQEEMDCENHFQSTHSRKPDGRYIVRLPFNNGVTQLGETKDLAMRRLIQLERRFKKYPIQHQLYIDFMDEYLSLGHMEEIPENEEKTTTAYYIPHHFVIKEDSTTTKLRVVFDASMKSSSGISLNETLLVGPTIQEDLFSLINRFRLHQVALKADIAKMYRQFEIHEDDRDYQRILWRRSDMEPVKSYRLKTVTYGTASAPFLATRCLTQLATDEEHNFPAAAAAVKSSMYVDDLLGGAPGRSEAKELFFQLSAMCKTGQMDIRKWCCSDDDVLSIIPESMRETISHDFDDSQSVKALGIKWQPKGDYFHFTVNLPQTQQSITKREMLSQIAKTFDPVGWLSPTIIIAKILMQDLWRRKLDWDTPVDSQLKSQWEEYLQQLQQLSSLKIPRILILPNTTDFQLHGFADSSEKAYASAVYLRCTDESGQVSCKLITSRTRVAPLKNTSLPRLELCAAHLLAETVEAVMRCFSMNISIHAWTDSMITLHWLQSPSRRWKTFVANRVAAIQEIIPPSQWRHVRSADNPADLPSRGIIADQLVDNTLWWNGPSWLINHSFPSSELDTDMEAVKQEEKIITIQSMLTTSQFSYLQLMSNFSSLESVVVTTAWLTRFVKFLKNKASVKPGPLTPRERKTAMQSIICLVQRESNQDFEQLQNKKQLSPKSRLSQLYPFIDEIGIVRVGGRLQQSSQSYDMIHPIILPSSHHITTLLIRQYHHDTLHGGFSLVLSMLRRKYWILRGRDTVRNVLRQCITCRKVKAESQQQLMGNLPSARVIYHRPFLHCGVDFAGPFHIKRRQGRNSPEDKAYMCIFICLSTKAVHLEAVSSLSTEAFLQTFRRLISRRGIPSHMYSDCGTNFQGAEKELQKLFFSQQTQQQLSSHGTTWIFNPPAAPHQGGLWEAAVKSAKFHLKRVLGTSSLSLEHFQTLLCNVEACMNSRPLCALSSDPTDTDALTPGHFLVGHPLQSLPDPDLTHIPTNRLNQWQHVTNLSQHFWKRWENEYLTTLQARGKWRRKHPNLCVGDLVVIKEDNIAPCKWKLGRIIKTCPGADGLVRKVILKTAAGGECQRPIAKLSLLLHNDD